ncbi:MAG: DNA polymerase III subunit gamma/tau [Eubacterium sp.]|nr:DNA polymerase III subunit gamma/tau [Eubacterium sp.]
MSYMALYRKWRPADFDQVKGQDAIVRTLRNQILYDRIGHAYLFCGTRGTGKTSIAKLFAKAVNCQNPVNGNPCNQCASCQAINSQSSLDVIEIDAASNNGVDHIREIREQVQYSPTMGRFKVYIIDEAHMLSSGAFNALLKTLEEPPSYVIFILATTEKHKIPVTILSRCQKYDFRRISMETITAHLENLMEKEEISAQHRALAYIARAADGSMRDALSLLDQCISFYLNQTLTYDNVLAVLGTVDTAVFSQLLRHILAQDTAAVLHVIDQTIIEGRELSQFLSDFLWYLRNLLILKDQVGAEESLDMSSEHIALLREETQMIDIGTLLRFIRVLSDLANQLRGASQKRILLEVGFIRLCTPQMETDTDSMLERLRLLEQKLSDGSFLSPDMLATAGALASAGQAYGGQTGQPEPGGRQAASGAKNDGPEKKAERLPAKTGEELLEERFSPAEAEDLKAIAAGWKDILKAAGMPMQDLLKNASPVVSEDSSLIRLLFDQEDFFKGYFERDHQHNLEVLSDIVANITGKRVRFECASRSAAPTNPTSLIDLSKIHQKVIFE